MTDVRDAPAPAANAEAAPGGAFIWYELMSPDPEGSKAFYDAVVGWDIGARLPEFDGYRMIGRSDGGMAGGVLAITDELRSHRARPLWLGYIGVDDVDAKVTEIEARGGKALMAPLDIETVGRIAMVADPQGIPFYVIKPIPPAGREKEESDVFSPTAEQRVGWNELTTPDPAGARQFYGELFGWTSDDFMPMGEMGEYRFFAHAGETIGAVCGVQPGGSKGWRYYVRVPSIGRAVEAVKANGGSVSMGPHEVPGGDQIVIGQDPQGAEFALVGKA